MDDKKERKNGCVSNYSRYFNNLLKYLNLFLKKIKKIEN